MAYVCIMVVISTRIHYLDITDYLPVILDIFSAIFSANPIFVLRPVPTAVPPLQYNTFINNSIEKNSNISHHKHFYTNCKMFIETI